MKKYVAAAAFATLLIGGCYAQDLKTADVPSILNCRKRFYSGSLRDSIAPTQFST